MYKLLRYVSAPVNMHIASPWIKSEIYGYVRDHDDIIAKAHRQAETILAQAHAEAEEIKCKARGEAVLSFQTDLDALRQFTRQTEQEMLSQSTTVCKSICETVVSQFIDFANQTRKMEILIRELLMQTFGVKELVLECSPGQQELTERVIAQLLSDQFNYRKWKVIPSHHLGEFELRVLSPNGAEVKISLQNVMAIYQAEVSQFFQNLDPHSRESESQL